MRIICVKWGDKYSDDYVYRLKAACERHIPHKQFWCMTDKRVRDVFCVPMNSDLPGWWSKVGLFRPTCFWGDNLYLDLDVVVTGNIQPLIDAYESDKSKLWALDDFSYTLTKPRKGLPAETQRLLGGVGTINSSVMLWNGGYAGHLQKVWTEFTTCKMHEVHGDQNWITQCLWPEHIRLLPPGVAISYKYSGGSTIAPIVVFHGNPKPHELDGWVAEHWAV